MVPYIERTRTYYEALGYPPYRWACFDEVPFLPLRRPLAESKAVLVTTAAPFRLECGDQGPGAAYNAGAKFYSVYSLHISPTPELCISHIAYDRDHTTAIDQNAYFPLRQLVSAVASGRIREVADIFIGVPTNRSQRVTIEQDAPAALERARNAGADVAVFVPNCPVCHQSVSLIARHFEENGISTVIMGCARDIVETCGVPRFLFSDFPLGNSAGKPNDEESQRDIMGLALDLLAEATHARTTWESPQTWSNDEAWKDDYSNVEKLSASEIQRRREEFSNQKETARQLRR